ncbi:hypothetical protein B0H19DRAFT_187842 [Mycena capillaripes]|nr:hypothetical protein B0H19DRAFT_187842 [Mycena capillaripes]
MPHEDECEFDYFSLPDKEAERLAQPHLLVLSQVSHRWHEIVMGTPQLWSAISVDASVWPDMDIEPAKLFRLFLAALRRSGNAPLRLKVTTGENKLTAGALLDAIIPHASRWREVYLDIRNGSYGLVDLPEGNLPLLDTLGLYLPKTVLHSFKDAPRLKTVELFGEPSKIPPMPWKQIRSFTYEGTQLSSPVLSWMQSLPAGCTTSLQIKQSHVGSVPLSPVSVAVKSVAIELGTWSNSFPIGPVLDALTLPGLRHFALTPWTSSSAFPSWSHAQYLRLAARSNFSSHLVSLHLRALITAGELIQTLTGLPLLETLRVADPGLRERRAAVITDPLLSTLTSSSSGGQNTSLPRLCAVHFDQSLLAFTDDILVNFVLSRRGTAANGRQFVVSISEATERERVILLTVRKLLKYELGVRFH